MEKLSWFILGILAILYIQNYIESSKLNKEIKSIMREMKKIIDKTKNNENK
jgi:hypothetical protein